MSLVTSGNRADLGPDWEGGGLGGRTHGSSDRRRVLGPPALSVQTGQMCFQLERWGRKSGCPATCLGRFLTMKWKESRVSSLCGLRSCRPARAWCECKCVLGVGGHVPPRGPGQRRRPQGSPVKREPLSPPSPPPLVSEQPGPESRGRAGEGGPGASGPEPSGGGPGNGLCAVGEVEQVLGAAEGRRLSSAGQWGAAEGFPGGESRGHRRGDRGRERSWRMGEGAGSGGRRRRGWDGSPPKPLAGKLVGGVLGGCCGLEVGGGNEQAEELACGRGELAQAVGQPGNHQQLCGSESQASMLGGEFEPPPPSGPGAVDRSRPRRHRGTGSERRAAWLDSCPSPRVLAARRARQEARRGLSSACSVTPRAPRCGSAPRGLRAGCRERGAGPTHAH